MSINSPRRLYVYFILYCISQGIWDAYEESFEQPYFEAAGLDLETLALAQTVDFLPWCVKFVWAIPSDAYNFFGLGHRRPYCVIGIFMAAMAFASLTLFSPGEYLGLYIAMMWSRNIGISIADSAVDGLSVDCAMDSEAGAIQAWMALGRTGGTITASVVGGYIALYSFKATFLALVVMALLVIPINFLIKEEWTDEKAYNDLLSTPTSSLVPTVQKYLDDKSKQSDGVHRADSMSLRRRPSFMLRVAKAVGFDWDLLEGIVGKRHVIVFLIYVACGTLGIATSAFAVTAWARIERDFSIDDVGNLTAALSAGAVVCELPLGYLFDRIPSKRIAMLMVAALAGIANLSFIWATTMDEVFVVTFWAGGAHGALFLVQNSMARCLADMRVGAAFLALVNSVANIMHAVGTGIGGPIGERIALEACFVFGGSICFASLIFVFFIPDHDVNEEEVHEEDTKVHVKPDIELGETNKTTISPKGNSPLTTTSIVQKFSSVVRLHHKEHVVSNPMHKGAIPIVVDFVPVNTSDAIVRTQGSSRNARVAMMNRPSHLGSDTLAPEPDKTIA